MLSVCLNKDGNVLNAKDERGGVGENEKVFCVALHCQIQEGIVGDRSRNLGRGVQKY